MSDRTPRNAQVRRRAVLLGALTTPLLAACGGSDADRFPAVTPGTPTGRRTGTGGPAAGPIVRTGLLTTRHWPGHRPQWIVVRPSRPEPAPVAISLHGKGGDAESSFTDLGMQRFVESLGLAVAAIDGGNYYWHARRSESTGDDDISPDTPPCDTGAMVVDDFIPLLGRMGLDVGRVGFVGWSMGGYGALLLAEQLGSRRVAAVAPMSAALWTRPEDSAPGAFDDAEDWAHNNVFARRHRYAGIPIRLACGTGDPFYQADRTFVSGFPQAPPYDVSAVFDPGGHDDDFWASHVGAQLGFLAAHLRG